MLQFFVLILVIILNLIVFGDGVSMPSPMFLVREPIMLYPLYTRYGYIYTYMHPLYTYIHHIYT